MDLKQLEDFKKAIDDASVRYFIYKINETDDISSYFAIEASAYNVMRITNFLIQCEDLEKDIIRNFIGNEKYDELISILENETAITVATSTSNKHYDYNGVFMYEDDIEITVENYNLSNRCIDDSDIYKYKYLFFLKFYL